MSKTRNLIILSILITLSAHLSHGQTRDIVSGKAYDIHSIILDEDRELQIGLPWNYESSVNSFPVLYLLDGWDYSFKYTQAVVEFLVENSKIPEMIVVGINNTNRDRDFTPTEFNQSSTGELVDYDQSGGADDFIRFLEEELKTHIDTTYRTLAFDMLLGHSLGGLLTSYIMLEKPSLFNAYIHLSPSVWWDNKLLIDQAEQKLKDWTPKRTTFTYYGYEMDRDSTSIHQQSTEELIAIIEENRPKSLKLKTSYLPSETHNSLVLKSTYDALEFIFEKYSLPHNGDILELITPQEISNHFKEASEELGYQVPIPEWYLNRTINFYTYYKNYHLALESAQLFIEHYPNSDQAYFSLATAYARLGEKKLAIKALEKVIEIQPTHQEAKQQMDELKK